MEALVQVSRLLMQQQALPDGDLRELLAIVVAAMLTQAVERISRVRQAAASCLRKLLQDQVLPAKAGMLLMISNALQSQVSVLAAPHTRQRACSFCQNSLHPICYMHCRRQGHKPGALVVCYHKQSAALVPCALASVAD